MKLMINSFKQTCVKNCESMGNGYDVRLGEGSVLSGRTISDCILRILKTLVFHLYALTAILDTP
jgi:hypothetical protein